MFFRRFCVNIELNEIGDGLVTQGQKYQRQQKVGLASENPVYQKQQLNDDQIGKGQTKKGWNDKGVGMDVRC